LLIIDDFGLKPLHALANVERAFRSLKTVDLKIRPIHHRTADRVRAHILLCMLAYYVEGHLLQGVGAIDVHRHRPGGQGDARCGGAGNTLTCSAREGRSPHASMTGLRCTASPP
jgi:hypothetical protein